jgi:adenylate cyclase class 2
MSSTLEREIKLRIDSAAAARAAIVALGGQLVRPRRLQCDALLDADDAPLRNSRRALRVRTEPGRAFVTFKGPPQQSVMKLREEVETAVDDGDLILAILERVGFRVWFRYEKFREEFRLDDVLMAIDETPVGTFLEIEGSDSGITDAAARLGFGPDAYVTSSYRALFVERCTALGIEPGDMVFPR